MQLIQSKQGGAKCWYMVGQITERVFEAYFWAILGILKGMYEF